MKLRHKVQIKIGNRNGITQSLLKSTRISFPKRLLTWLFGDFCEVLVLTHGETVEEIEIQELRGERND